MGKRDRLENPQTYFPDVPSWAVPMLQSQAREEVTNESIERSIKALWARYRDLPCVDHKETLARMDERLNTLEDKRGRTLNAEAQADAIQQGLMTFIKRHKTATGSGIIGTIVTLLFALIKSGVLG